MNSELKPCPFCGDVPERFVREAGARFMTACRNPDCEVQPEALDGDSAANADRFWNARLPTLPVEINEGEVERIARAMFSRSPAHVPWENANARTREIYLEDARAALTAMNDGGE